MATTKTAKKQAPKKAAKKSVTKKASGSRQPKAEKKGGFTGYYGYYDKG